MRVLLVGPLPPPMGGDTRHFVTLYEDLQADPAVDVSLINTSRQQGFTNPVKNLWVALRTMAAVLARLHRVDVVSFQASDRGMTLFGPVIVTAGKLARTPTIIRLFGGSFGNYYHQQGPVTRFVLRRFVLNADVILLQTKRLIEQIEPIAIGRTEWFSTYIRQPVDAEQRFLEAEPEDDRRCSRFIFLGHLWETKGIDTLLESAGSLPEGVTIDVFGPTDQYSEADFLERGHGRVKYRGFLSHAEVDEVLWGYDCLVLPTFHKGEGYPGVIAEAFAHGLPVITTNWLAIPDMVDSTCGVLIEPRDTPAFVAAVTALNADRDAWLKMRNGARAKAGEFDHSVWAHTFSHLCEGLVGK